MTTKMTILAQECFRRIHNTCEKVDDDTRTNILNEFMCDLKRCRYKEQERKNILDSGARKHCRLKEKE